MKPSPSTSVAQLEETPADYEQDSLRDTGKALINADSPSLPRCHAEPRQINRPVVNTVLHPRMVYGPLTTPASRFYPFYSPAAASHLKAGPFFLNHTQLRPAASPARRTPIETSEQMDHPNPSASHQREHIIRSQGDSPSHHSIQRGTVGKRRVEAWDGPRRGQHRRLGSDDSFTSIFMNILASILAILGIAFATLAWDYGQNFIRRFPG